MKQEFSERLGAFQPTELVLLQNLLFWDIPAGGGGSDVKHVCSPFMPPHPHMCHPHVNSAVWSPAPHRFEVSSGPKVLQGSVG